MTSSLQMKSKMNRQLKKSIFPFLFLLFSQETLAQNRCESVFANPAVQFTSHELLSAPGFYEKLLIFDPQGYAYAKGSPQTPGKEIQFGFESEYSVNELARFTNFYGPPRESGIAKEAWLATPIEGRMAWIKEKLKTIPFGSKDSVLVLLEATPELSFLPPKLIRDDTGNVEIILEPVSSFDVFKKQVQWINENFGIGSMQSMVSQPKETFYNDSPGYKEVALKENLGYFNFINEADVLSRMASGAERFHADRTKEVMKPFLHPYLGPMVKLRHKKMVETMKEVSDGKILNADESRKLIRREQSFKYIGSTAYRPDIANVTRASQEIRDAHKDQAMLLDRTARSIFYAQQGRVAFLGMGGIKAFDSRASFEALPSKIQELLMTIFPPNIPAKIQDHENSRFAHETYRNFSYPTKDWSSWLQALDRMDLNKTVQAAQESYLKKLGNLQTLFESKQIGLEKVRAEVQGALAEFAIESRLEDAFKKFENSAPTRSVVSNTTLAGPRRAFEFRLESFLKKWPDQVTIVNGTKFRYKDRSQKTTSLRRTLVISVEGLSEAQKTNLKIDYQNLIAAQTISFPLREKARHALFQFNGQIYDHSFFITQKLPLFREKDYSISEYRRLETIALLSRTEESRMLQYVTAIKKSRSKVLGKFNLQGDQKTNGQLDNNVSQGCGHNCTTWGVTAPIGKNGETLMSLLGGDQTSPWVAVNPGWMGNWIIGTASQERIPLVVYWTAEKLAKSLETEFNGSELKWDFGRR